MKNKFIPVDNNINKAIAFANTLDSNNIVNVQKIKQKPFYIPTMDVVERLQNEGWLLKGVAEHRVKSKKVESNYVQLQHPDFAVLNKHGKTEAYTSITISNSCSGAKPLQMSLGVFRQVCTNGMVAFDQHGESEIIKHTEVNFMNLQNFIAAMTNKTGHLLNSVNEMKHRGLNIEQMKKLAYEAAKLKYSDLRDINTDNLLTVNRIEDEGNDVWTVFNRIQENLTHDITNMNRDIKINQQLFAMAEQYAFAV